MFLIRSLGLDKKPLQPEIVSASSLPVKPWKQVEDTVRSTPSATCGETLDRSSDEYEDVCNFAAPPSLNIIQKLMSR